MDIKIQIALRFLKCSRKWTLLSFFFFFQNIPAFSPAPGHCSFYTLDRYTSVTFTAWFTVSLSLTLSLNLSRSAEIGEASLVRDILYVFQGIDGKFIKMCTPENCYKIDSKVNSLLVIHECCRVRGILPERRFSKIHTTILYSWCSRLTRNIRTAGPNWC